MEHILEAILCTIVGFKNLATNRMSGDKSHGAMQINNQWILATKAL